MKTTKLDYLEILYQAIREKYGLVVSSKSPLKLRNKLYPLRNDPKNPELKILSFIVSPLNPQEDLWIVKVPANVKDIEPLPEIR